MKQAAIYAGVFVFGFMCGVVGIGLFAIAMTDPVTATAKKPASYRSACYRSIT